jgi:hypothetical protein
MTRVLLAALAGATLLAACADAPVAEPTRSGGALSSANTVAESRGTTPGGVPLSIAAEVGGRRYTGSGTGDCIVEPDGTIYDAPTAMYAAQDIRGESRGER